MRLVLHFFLFFILLPITSYCDDFFLKINEWADCKKINLAHIAFQEKAIFVADQEVSDFELQAPSGLKVPVRFYDRQSDTVVIVGQGLPAPKEVMEDFADLFASYDVLLFDYRWNNKYGTMLLKSLATGKVVNNILLQEIEEVETVINFIKTHKNYTKVIALGECYSNFLFAKLQAESVKKDGKGPFTHLIFDSCWYSLRSFAERVCFDPFLPIRPRSGGAPRIVKAITSSKIFKWCTLGLVFKIMRNISIAPYLAGLNAPALFIHGRNDLFVPQEHFKKIWGATDHQNRAVLLTPYVHCANLSNWQVYKYMCKTFIQSSSIKEFEAACNDIFT